MSTERYRHTRRRCSFTPTFYGYKRPILWVVIPPDWKTYVLKGVPVDDLNSYTPETIDVPQDLGFEVPMVSYWHIRDWFRSRKVFIPLTSDPSNRSIELTSVCPSVIIFTTNLINRDSRCKKSKWLDEEHEKSKNLWPLSSWRPRT